MEGTVCAQEERRKGRTPPFQTEQIVAVEQLNILLMENWMWLWCLGCGF